MIVVRHETAIYKVEASIYILRMVMLVSSLKITGYSYLHPIFVSLCGVMQAGASVFKAMSGKSSIFKLTIEDVA